MDKNVRMVAAIQATVVARMLQLDQMAHGTGLQSIPVGTISKLYLDIIQAFGLTDEEYLDMVSLAIETIRLEDERKNAE